MPSDTPSTSHDRGLTKLWRPRATAPSPTARTSLTERILQARGLTDEAAAAYLAPSLRQLHDPSRIPGLDRAAERLMRALADGDQIVIFGDYDVDGVTATAILVRLLRNLGPSADIRAYIPHRVDEGYGLNTQALQTLAEEGARVVVSVDCGITAIEPAQAAEDLGLDLIITDHHNPPESEADLPDAYAVVHPRAPGSDYPFADLCGAGVAYKLAWKLATMHAGSERVGDDLRDLLLDLLALAALGTVADVVPLIDENRPIARFGLSRCQSSPIIGLRALVDACGLGAEKIDAEHAGFQLGPRLNACGRLGHARDALQLFLTEDPREAATIAAELSTLNDRRRSTERAIFKQACEMAEHAGMTGPDCRAIVLAHEDWHPGVVGIVCSRLVEKYARPAILMQRKTANDGTETYAGSGRSIDAFNLHAALTACDAHLLTYGGHDMAAGLRCDAANLQAFTEALIDHANANLTADDLVSSIEYDTDARIEELTPQAVRDLNRLAPFGRANPAVRLRLRNLRLAATPDTFGAAGNHLKLRLRTTDHAARTEIQAVAWKWAEHASKLNAGQELEAIVTPKVSTYNGRVEPVIEDLRLTNTTRPVIHTRPTAAPAITNR